MSNEITECKKQASESPLEVWTMAKPVITTDILGARRLIVDSQTEFLVEPKSSKALIGPLNRLLRDPQLRKDMRQKGRKRVEEMTAEI